MKKIVLALAVLASMQGATIIPAAAEASACHTGICGN